MKKNSILLAVCCCVLTVVAGCAAPGAPQPPSLRIPMTVDNLSGYPQRRARDSHLVASRGDHRSPNHALAHGYTHLPDASTNFPINVCGEVVKEIKSSELATVRHPGRAVRWFPLRMCCRRH